MEIKTKFDEIKPETLVEMMGVNGKFYIGRAGARPELGSCYFYGDKCEQFFFYLRSEACEEGGYNINIHAASVYRIRGPFFVPNKENIEIIKENITKFFSIRDFFSPQRQISPANDQKNIIFTWGIS
ncbi:MAG: hypothetical protein PW843_11105 [Azospirillaceae bacterium]|nr:hypothetical protein [Azospirillaceae bacterium]